MTACAKCGKPAEYGLFCNDCFEELLMEESSEPDFVACPNCKIGWVKPGDTRCPMCRES